MLLLILQRSTTHKTWNGYCKNGPMCNNPFTSIKPSISSLAIYRSLCAQVFKPAFPDHIRFLAGAVKSSGRVHDLQFLLPCLGYGEILISRSKIRSSPSINERWAQNPITSQNSHRTNRAACNLFLVIGLVTNGSLYELIRLRITNHHLHLDMFQRLELLWLHDESRPKRVEPSPEGFKKTRNNNRFLLCSDANAM